MRLRPRSRWILAAAAVFSAAAVAGFAAAGRLSPALLRGELEARLAEALASPVRVESVGLSLGFSLKVIGRGVSAYDGPEGPALAIERVTASVRPFAHLTGQPRLGRLVLERPQLRVARDARGRWTPEAAGALLARRGGPEPRAREPRASEHPDEILSPLIVLEAIARELLASPLPAERIELRDGSLEWADARPADGSARFAITWHSIGAEVHRRPLLGDTQLALRAWLREGSAERGSVELEGRLARGGAMRVALAATDLDLAAATALPASLSAGVRTLGTASGVVLFEAPSPGSGRFEVDLVGRRVRAHRSRREPRLGPLAAERIELAGTVEIDPQEVRVHTARLATERLSLRLEGRVARPLRRTSPSELSFALGELPLADARTLLAWLPDVEREEAEALLANLEAGLLHRLEAGGSATLGEWQEFLAGRSRRVPRNFSLLADLEDVRLRTGDDTIEALGGRLAWAGERLEVRGLRARLGGRPLPILDLEVQGIASFFATDPQLRLLTASAPPLAGLGALWKDLRPKHDDGQPGRIPVDVHLEIERLEHPMFLWPIAGLSADITPLERGLRVEARDGTWGGVPVELSADWLFEPEERVIARVAAGGVEVAEGAAASPAVAGAAPPGARAPAGGGHDPLGDGAWARGRLAVGPVDAPRWKQKSATGRFEAFGAKVRVADARFELAPHGRGLANALVDLSRPEAAPFQMSFEVFDADLPSFGAAVKLPKQLASGRVDAAGSVEWIFDPEAEMETTLQGLIDVDARDGTLEKRIPAVMALALASDGIAPLGGRDLVHYDRLRALLALGGGRLSSEALTLDGPDARAFASGNVALGEGPHAIEVDVVLFLFRPVDWLLDKIPLVNFLLLGPNRNLLAAHYELTGFWEEPSVRLVPLESIASGPGTLVFEGLPSIVSRGMQALGGLFERDQAAEAPTPGEEAEKAREKALPPEKS